MERLIKNIIFFILISSFINLNANEIDKKEVDNIEINIYKIEKPKSYFYYNGNRLKNDFDFIPVFSLVPDSLALYKRAIKHRNAALAVGITSIELGVISLGIFMPGFTVVCIPDRKPITSILDAPVFLMLMSAIPLVLGLIGIPIYVWNIKKFFKLRFEATIIYNNWFDSRNKLN